MLTVIKSFKNIEPMSQNIENNASKDNTVYVPVEDNSIYVPITEYVDFGCKISTAEEVLKLAKKNVA